MKDPDSDPNSPNLHVADSDRIRFHSKVNVAYSSQRTVNCSARKFKKKLTVLMWSHSTGIESADVKRSAKEEMVAVQRQPSRTVVFRTRTHLSESGSRYQIVAFELFE
jgi:hypothetical protein